MNQLLVLLGIALIFIGMLAVVLGSFLGKGKTEWAVGGFIGPFPIGAASSKGMLWALIAVMAVLAAVWLLLGRGF
ncbi:MAG: TIGR00304 family protein [Candidatus Aenigmatarchaeota archaeon]